MNRSPNQLTPTRQHSGGQFPVIAVSKNSPTQSEGGASVAPFRSPNGTYNNNNNHNGGASFLRDAKTATRMIDEGEDPMANIVEDQTQPGAIAPRNMTAWLMRATTSVLGKRYITQDASANARELATALRRNAYIQTEPPVMKDASAMIIDGNMESERLNVLDIGIPGPADLPVLTTSQMLEMERRLGDLMSRLADEITRAEGEIKRAKEQQAELEKREAIMHSNRFGQWQTNDEWLLHMRNKIEQRLHRRHGYADVPSLPAQKENLDACLNSPLRQKHARARKADLAGLLGVDGGSSRSLSQDGQSNSTTPPLAVTPRSVTPSNAAGLQRKPSFVAFQDPVVDGSGHY